MKCIPLFRIPLFLFPLLLVSCAEDDEPEVSCDGSLAVSVASVDDSGCESATGSISVTGSGGTGSYTFRLDGGSFQSSGTFRQVAAGVHQLTVRDENNCTAVVEETVLSGVTLGAIRPIIVTNCAVANCHNGDRPNLPNYNLDSEILSRVSQIKTRTGDKTMPPPGTSTSLTDGEIQQIACWADDGGPE